MEFADPAFRGAPIVQFRELRDLAYLKRKLYELIPEGFEIKDEDTTYQKLHELPLKLMEMVAEKEELDKQSRQLWNELCRIRGEISDRRRRSELPRLVPSFLAAIHRAERYFDFKEAAKRKYWNHFRAVYGHWDWDDIENTLLEDGDLLRPFDGIHTFDIQQAASAINGELMYDHVCSKQLGPYEKPQDSVLDVAVFNLVFKTREQGYLLDQDPEVELERIMKSDMEPGMEQPEVDDSLVKAPSTAVSAPTVSGKVAQAESSGTDDGGIDTDLQARLDNLRKMQGFE